MVEKVNWGSFGLFWFSWFLFLEWFWDDFKVLCDFQDLSSVLEVLSSKNELKLGFFDLKT